MGWDELDKCYLCGVAIPPRPGFVPGCAPCMIAAHEKYLLFCAWRKKVSAMGAHPGKRTKRAAWVRFIAETARAANDNGVAFGTERRNG